jgi:alkylation response protein AidB-like acyl-CoA dehydrogenase
MNFSFTDDQLAFRDAVRDLLEKECPPSVVRDAWTNESGRTSADGRGGVWAQLGEMGVLGMLAPEASGGMGLTELDLVLLLEECGRAGLPEPVVEHAAVGVPLVEEVTAAAAGEVTITAVFADEMVVPWGETADLLLLHRDGRLHLAEREAVTLTPLESVDGSRRLTTVEWDPARATALDAEVAPLSFDRGALATAAVLCGLSARMLMMTVEYAKERTQFGVPIGSFQAVKHQLADARIALEFAQPLVYRAAWSTAQGDAERATHVSMAKAKASSAALLAGRAALQCHGAMGYSYEYDLHLFLKRAWALAAAWGDARWHRTRVRRALLPA